VKTVQFNKSVTCAQRDGNNPIQVHFFITNSVFTVYDSELNTCQRISLHCLVFLT